MVFWDKIGKALKSFSKALKDFEPLFNFIEVFFVVVGTVLVSGRANFIAQQANLIAEAQLSVSKAENQPNFIIDQILEPDSKGTENANAVLYINNIGGIFYNFDAETAFIIELNYIDENLEVAKHSFSLKDFYGMSVSTNNMEGLVRKMYLENNWERLCKLYQDVLSDPRLDSGYIDFWQYVKISYEDIYREKHIAYYMYNGIRQRLITQEAGEQAFLEYNKNSNIVSVDALSVDKLLEQIN